MKQTAKPQPYLEERSSSLIGQFAGTSRTPIARFTLAGKAANVCSPVNAICLRSSA
ncbi:hypothetical protein [Bradyrhizobium sp. RD5-C2]|uniref:hypothetical protein n=1 Tax=Bradyrhizobium sp. RD5-C2 TaxID=244562 RepID=UPI001CC467B4|nr:hypothetical protein [Bradyrhizobium sp. RD5-C2]